mgnify:CR=1 FL=1
MQSEKKTVESEQKSVIPPVAPPSGHPRRTLIRAVLLSVPMVITLSSNASAAVAGSSYAS